MEEKFVLPVDIGNVSRRLLRRNVLDVRGILSLVIRDERESSPVVVSEGGRSARERTTSGRPKLSYAFSDNARHAREGGIVVCPDEATGCCAEQMTRTHAHAHGEHNNNDDEDGLDWSRAKMELSWDVGISETTSSDVFACTKLRQENRKGQTEDLIDCSSKIAFSLFFFTSCQSRQRRGN